MHPPVLTRSLVAVSVWHISTAQLIPVGFDISLILGYLLLPLWCFIVITHTLIEYGLLLAPLLCVARHLTWQKYQLIKLPPLWQTCNISWPGFSTLSQLTREEGQRKRSSLMHKRHSPLSCCFSGYTKNSCIAGRQRSDVALCQSLQDILNWETFYTQGDSLLASSLVAMEMAFGFKLWQGEFNLEFTKTVSSGFMSNKTSSL